MHCQSQSYHITVITNTTAGNLLKLKFQETENCLFTVPSIKERDKRSVCILCYQFHAFKEIIELTD